MDPLNALFKISKQNVANPNRVQTWPCLVIKIRYSMVVFCRPLSPWLDNLTALASLKTDIGKTWPQHEPKIALA